MKKLLFLLLCAFSASGWAQPADKPFKSLYVWGFSSERADIDTLQVESLYKSARKALADVQFSSGFALLERVEAEVLYSQAKEEEAFLHIANAGPQGKATLEKVIQATKADAVLLGKVSREPNGNLLMEMSISHLRTFQLIATEEVELSMAQITDRNTRNKLMAEAVATMLARCCMMGSAPQATAHGTPNHTFSLAGTWVGSLAASGDVEFGGTRLGGNFCFYSCAFNETRVSINLEAKASAFTSIYSEKGLYGCQQPTAAAHRVKGVAKTFVYDATLRNLSITYTQTEGVEFGYKLSFTGFVREDGSIQGELTVERPTFQLFPGYVKRMEIVLYRS